MRRRAASILPLVASWPAMAGIDKPWQELGSDSDGGSVLTGLILLALGYAAWRLFVSGDLGALIGSVVRFLLAVYLPVGLFLAVAVLASLGLQAAGLEKGTAGLLALLAAGGVAWLVVHLTLSRKADDNQRQAAHTDRDD
ncbi:MAG: hypothetical protein Fur0014_07440 [Rubrivivax sp.]